jgi:hypothetical protein
MKLNARCLRVVFASVALVGVTCIAGYRGDRSLQQLSYEEEAAMLGGAGPWTANECEPGSGGCPNNSPSANVNCGLLAPGAVCPGTAWCQSTQTNWVCGPTYSTWNPLDFTCVVNPPVNCSQVQRICSTNGTCSVISAGFPGCGTRSDCSY